MVEDEQDSRDLIGITLTHAGGTPTLCASVDEAMAAIDGWTAAPSTPSSPTSAFPAATATSCCATCAGTPHLSRIPIVALSARARREDEESALGVRFDAYLEKPVDVPGADRRRRRRDRRAYAAALRPSHLPLRL